MRLLFKAQEANAKTARKLFPLVDKASDQPTADLLTSVKMCMRKLHGCCAAYWKSKGNQ